MSRPRSAEFFLYPLVHFDTIDSRGSFARVIIIRVACVHVTLAVYCADIGEERLETETA